MNKYINCSLIYIKEKCTLILEGKRISFCQDDLILIRNFFNNDCITNHSKKCIHFSADLLYEYIFFNRDDFIRTNRICRRKYIVVKSSNADIIRGIFSKLDCMEEQHVKKAAIFFLLSCFHLERDFFSFFLGFYSVGYKISGIIKTDIRHQWRLNEIARTLCLCVSTVKKHLKQENTSFIKILTECRMEHAAKLLLISNKNVNTISAECGYNNVSYFIMTFTKYYGLSPHKYAQKYALYNKYEYSYNK
ncbi:helix-turn-helix domain-containing protein [Escherichia coli]|uniref:helix-turn-helix domain-containing protein n=1 Tax=Escherichia coli TaxID=562 RepID=UPI000D160C83|nr:helix-turn-helix domain-containing protein [Escherichia coli]MBB9725943.1 helix-turn-helix domain-containing protein [Escherichia coli]PSY47360.1 hypothetical protein C7B19_24815 [Escherichia coli]